MKRLFLFFFAGVLFVGCQSQSSEPPSITYDIRFDNARHNEAEIILTLENLDQDPVTISMSRTSPGRYALHEFAKNIYDVRAVDAEGDTLDISRPDLHNWTVSGHDGTVKFHYTLYGRHADGTYTGINEQHAHLNMPATFVWVRDLSDIPVEVQFHPPKEANWKVATQLKATDAPYTFMAPNYYYFMDSPTELSNFTMTEWKAPSDTTGQKIKLAVHHNGTQQEVERYTEMAKKVVAEQVAIYGAPADFDYDSYTFITDYLPYVYGDGMEHRNSTILTSQTSLKGEGALQNLYTLSHEFFHSWNVERMRPKSLEPFDFMEANVSEELWFAEGFTSYYDDLTIRRAELISDQKYANDWEGTLNYVLNSSGNNYYSPMGMSRQAPFVDAARSVDAQNKSNTFISYYSWGAVLGLGLDLTLRSTFDGVTLDDYMRLAWKKYGKNEKSYTISDLEHTLAELTDSTKFAQTFFNSHIYQGKQINLTPLLAQAGFDLRKANPQQAVMSFGAEIDYRGNKAEITSNTHLGSPLYKAGLDAGDVIMALDGNTIRNARDVQRVLVQNNPGDEISILFKSLGKVHEQKLTLAQDPQWELIPFENTDKELTNGMKRFRKDWLGSKAQ